MKTVLIHVLRTIGKDKIRNFFKQIEGIHALMAKVMYGSGLRLMACIRLRIMNVDFDRKRIHVIGKGDKWRSTVLPPTIIPELKDHIETRKALHHQDLQEGFGRVHIPAALSRKYKNAATETQW